MLANTVSPAVNRAVITGKDSGQGQPTVEYVYRHLTMYGQNRATLQGMKYEPKMWLYLCDTT